MIEYMIYVITRCKQRISTGKTKQKIAKVLFNTIQGQFYKIYNTLENT